MRMAIAQSTWTKPQILDGLENYTRAAYSLRQLYKRYTGRVIELTNGTTTLDIGLKKGVLDSSAVLSLGNLSWVTKFYDHGPLGNHTIARGGAAARNYLVIGGQILTSNGRPSILTAQNGVDGFVLPLGVVNGVSDASCATTYRQVDGNGAAAVIICNIGEDLCASPYSDGQAYEAFMGVMRTPPGGFAYGFDKIMHQQWKENDVLGFRLYKNTTLKGAITQTTVVNPSIRLLGSNIYGRLEIAEFIMFDRVLPINKRLEISANTKTFYNLI